MKRESIGTAASVAGGIVNAGLFAAKLAVGLLSGSISVMSDAVNNISDALSDVGMAIGYRISRKRPDKEHPYGHGRTEYVMGLTMAVIIILVGVEFFKSSVERLVFPTTVKFEWLFLGIILGSAAVKIFLGIFYAAANRKVRSDALKLAARDSFWDSALTALTAIALATVKYTDFPVDAAFGLILSLVIIIVGVKNLEETFSPILGKSNPELNEKVLQTVVRHKNILGAHDLKLHNYGKDYYMGCVHAEIPTSLTLYQAHSLIDDIEKDVMNEHNVDLAVHMDPISEDELAVKYRRAIEEKLRSLRPDLTYHGFTLNNYNKSVSVDIVVPYNKEINENALKAALSELDFGGYELYLKIDRE